MSKEMLKYSCHFCGHTEEFDNTKIHYYCFPCQRKYDIAAVITSTGFPNNKNNYAHIIGNGYHIRLNIEDNTTDIMINYRGTSSGDQILSVPGFPITSANFKEKLKMILTFQ
jgi:hypothetical protein